MFGQLQIKLPAPTGAAPTIDQKVIDTALVNVRNNLHLSAQTDRLKICKPPEQKGQLFDPYGPVVACLTDHVRHDESDFRKGLRWQFQHFLSTNRKPYADKLVPLIEQTIVVEAKMAPGDARYYVWRDYKTVFGTYPVPMQLLKKVVTAPATAPFPRIPSIPTTVTPMPRLPLPGTDEELYAPAEAEVAAAMDDKPPYLLYVAGAVLLLGVGYLATRRS